jgi:hypothetical protein
VRHMAAFTILVLVLVVANTLLFPKALAACGRGCEFYGMIASDSHPSPGDEIYFTGVVTDQFGAGAAGVQVSYKDNAPRYNSSLVSTLTDSNGAFHLHTNIPANASSQIQFTINLSDPATSWSQLLSDSFPTPSPTRHSPFPVLYESDQPLPRMQAVLNLESHSVNGALNPIIIYVSGGYEQPALHGVPSFDQSTMNFLTTPAGSGFNVAAPVNWQSTALGPTSFPIFPFIIAALFKYGFRASQVYLLGWSAGGTIAAWALTHDIHRLFDLGVIMDAELNGPENASLTDSTVFSTLASAGQVGVPHLLIWGANEGGANSIQYAMQWARNAAPGLARLDAFGYSHVWTGTVVQPLIAEDVLGFFSANPHSVGTISHIELGNLTMQVLTNSQINATSSVYDPQRKVITLQVTGESGTVGSLNAVIPKSSIDGEPAVFLDGNPTDAPYASDANNYYIYLSYTHSAHSIVIGGQNNLPEFPDQATWLLLMVALSLLLLNLIKRQRPLDA